VPAARTGSPHRSQAPVCPVTAVITAVTGQTVAGQPSSPPSPARRLPDRRLPLLFGITPH